MRYPAAEWKPIPSHSGAMTEDLGLILHVTTNHADPYGFFDNPKNEASSTVWISDSGHVEQYVEFGVRAWAQAAGNATYNSAEVSGVPDEPMTAAEIEALAHLYAWGHVHRGWKMQLADKPGERGFGWHGMGGEAWGGHLGCPGNVRKAQRQHILDRAAEILASGATPAAPQPAPSHPVIASPQPSAPAKAAKVAALQAAVHCSTDGIWGPTTDHRLFVLRAVARGGAFNVREAQSVVGARVDGVWGPKSKVAAKASVEVAQHALGVVVDGVWGPRTESAFQAARAKYRRA